RRAI
ncbi:Threonine--tRNA ligase, partial [Haemophilus influenzae]